MVTTANDLTYRLPFAVKLALQTQSFSLQLSYTLSSFLGPSWRNPLCGGAGSVPLWGRENSVRASGANLRWGQNNTRLRSDFSEYRKFCGQWWCHHDTEVKSSHRQLIAIIIQSLPLEGVHLASPSLVPMCPSHRARVWSLFITALWTSLTSVLTNCSEHI